MKIIQVFGGFGGATCRLVYSTNHVLGYDIIDLRSRPTVLVASGMWHVH